MITVSALADFDGQPGGTGSGSVTFTNCSENVDDSFACFSNYGSGVDIMAPGVRILSTWNDDGITDYNKTLSDGIMGYNPSTDTNPLSANTDADAYPDGTDPVPTLYNYEDGNVAPYGSPDGETNAGDLLVCMQLVLGIKPVTNLELAHADLYPVGLVSGIVVMGQVEWSDNGRRMT